MTENITQHQVIEARDAAYQCLEVLWECWVSGIRVERAEDGTPDADRWMAKMNSLCDSVEAAHKRWSDVPGHVVEHIGRIAARNRPELTTAVNGCPFVSAHQVAAYEVGIIYNIFLGEDCALTVEVPKGMPDHEGKLKLCSAMRDELKALTKCDVHALGERVKQEYYWANEGLEIDPQPGGVEPLWSIPMTLKKISQILGIDPRTVRSRYGEALHEVNRQAFHIDIRKVHAKYQKQFTPQ